MAKKVSEMAGTLDIFSESLNIPAVEKVKKGLPSYYFPLVIGIILVEAVLLILVLLNILPFHPLEIYPQAGYFSYIGTNDISRISVTITRWFFFALTAGVLLPVMVIITLEVIRRIIIHRRGELDARDEKVSWTDRRGKSLDNPGLTQGRIQGDYIVRFDVHQRIQHLLLMTSFIILAVTGLVRGFPDWPTFHWFMGAFGGPAILRLVHDITAFVMVLDVIYHLSYIAYGYFVKGKFPYAMLPNTKDVKDIIHTFQWIFGWDKREPEYERFGYGQKIDYWAIFWGMPVMVITGIIMMFPAFFSQWFAGQWFAVAVTAHRDEALLAVGFILIVHIYYGHFQTTAFPVNTVMFTGKMLKSKYKQWFGREYAQLAEEKDEP